MTATIDHALAVFTEHWGHKQFRKAQKQVIEAAIRDEDILAVLPTSYGKSACFQVPAVMSNGTAIVVSPLIALMKDQVDDCNKRGIAASYVNSHVNDDEQAERLNKLTQGEYMLFYIAPERINNYRFREAIQRTEVSYVVVDEAHCCSRFGHDFRPAYMRIRKLVELITHADERPPIIAVTATATADIEDDIAESLGMDEGFTRIVGDPIRPNLKYQVMHGNAWSNMRHLIRRFNPEGGRYVIYAGTRKGSEKLCSMIDETLGTGLAGFYHAGMTKPERESIQDAFKEGRVPIVVATNAFGMGIDVPNIRAVVHFGIPGSLEDYCQESGRAGRDGLPSDVILIDDDFSHNLRQMFLDNANPPFHAFATVWDWLHQHLDEGETLNLSGEKISHKIKEDMFEDIHGAQVNGVLSTMDAYGLVHRSYLGAGTSVTVDVPEMRRALLDGDLSNQQKEVAEFLWELVEIKLPAEYRGGVQKCAVDVNVDDCADATALAAASIKRALKKLEDKGLIEVQATFRGKSTRINMYGATLEDVLPREKIEAKRDREQRRLNKMITYTRTGDRLQFIRDYFLKGF